MSSTARKRARGAAVLPSAAESHSASFTAVITGDVQATIGGDAAFSELPASDGASSIFRLLLGPLSAQGTVLLSWRSDSPPVRGIYAISGWKDSFDHVEGLMMLGPVERPLAELQADSGTLRIIEATNARLVGSFAFTAVGRQGSRVPLRLSLSGSFTARAS